MQRTGGSGLIFNQPWHFARISHRVLQPVTPSGITPSS
jgi:hypothetical protein